MKRFLSLMAPLLMFPLLYIPYSIFNVYYLVDWLGCGCPTVDENGCVVEKAFSANDFTACFWFAVALATVLISFFSARKHLKERPVLRVVYMTTVAVVSLFLMYFCVGSMMWN